MDIMTGRHNVTRWSSKSDKRGEHAVYRQREAVWQSEEEYERAKEETER